MATGTRRARKPVEYPKTKTHEELAEAATAPSYLENAPAITADAEVGPHIPLPPDQTLPATTVFQPPRPAGIPTDVAGTFALASMTDDAFEERLLALKRGRDRIARIQRELMEPDVDYGLIPGTPKPTLFKPGAEKLAQIYGLAARVETTFVPGDGDLTPPLQYSAECFLHLGSFEGPIVGVGHGTANSWEKRYRRDADKACPNCGKTAIIKSKFEPGWYCFPKKGGCGSKFAPNDEGITSQVSDPKGNATEAWDLDVTLLKMCLAGTTPLVFRGEAGIVRHDVAGLWSHHQKGQPLWLPGTDGGWRRVLSMERIEDRQIFRIVLRDGSVIRATGEHRFPTDQGLIHVGDMAPGLHLTRRRVPLDDPRGADPEIAWVAGLFIAEGSYPQAGACRFTLHAKEVEYAARIRLLAERVGATSSQKTRPGTQTMDVVVYGSSFRGLMDHFVAGGGSRGKHFSRHVWRQGLAFVSQSLDGYLAGDGSLTDRAGHSPFVELGFTGENAELAEDLRAACAMTERRLVLRRGRSWLKDVEFPTFTGWIRDNPRYHPANLDEIVSVGVEPVAGPVYDIEVDGDHLFLLSNGIVTHNSEKRAFVDAVLRATASSSLFTQDMAEEPAVDHSVDNSVVTTAGGAKVDSETGEVVAKAPPPEAEPEVRAAQLGTVQRGGHRDEVTDAQIAQARSYAQGLKLGPWQMADLIAKVTESDWDGAALDEDRAVAGREVLDHLKGMHPDDMGKLLTAMRKQVEGVPA